MKITVLGAGVVGTAAAYYLASDGHDVTVLTRDSISSGQLAATGAARSVVWTPNGESGPWASAIDGAGAVVNLAGESIAAKRWTAAQKQKILDTRVRGLAIPHHRG